MFQESQEAQVMCTPQGSPSASFGWGSKRTSPLQKLRQLRHSYPSCGVRTVLPVLDPCTGNVKPDILVFLIAVYGASPTTSGFCADKRSGPVINALQTPTIFGGLRDSF